MTPLSRNLALTCHAIRFGALAWFAWSAVRVALLWSDPDAISRMYARLAGVAPAPLTSARYAASLAIILVLVALSAQVARRVWQLFGCYLDGDIFAARAVDAMANLGCAGLIASFADLAARPLMLAVVTGPGTMRMWGDPNDLLHVMVSLLVLVMAHVFKAGVAIAEENRQIV